ncbi:GGDEF domain-containing protein [Herbaspirillum lusitanum]|uniref:GGDEF domain-containing protein n=1 Tax=Herbaspirillum lusitanum TaxID=213312 RepID=UPI0038BCBD35
MLLMHLIRKRVVRPLVDAKNLVVSLAEGNLDANIPRSRHADEVGGMMRALQVLRARIMERNSLAREREELITQLQASSNTDFLTGVWNRRAFYTHAQQQMAVAQRYQRDLAIVMFDIDWFKRINDEYGHLAGDEILRGVAQTVQQLLRKVDVLARYGGEEFIVLLPESDLQNGMAVAQKLREALEQKSFVVDGGQELRVTASFGVAASVGQQALEQLIKLADEALYTAKDQGRNRVEMAVE